MLPRMDAELRREFILASALFHERPPDADGYVRANSARVLRNALRAAGLWDQRLQEGQAEAFHGIYDRFPDIKMWYDTLIELVRHEPESERLLQGAGNLIDPAGASFTACWLTPRGRETAEKLLATHPDWENKLTLEKPRD